jgi:alkanesulfonate monooxygenase SsuD/methylene tetrahydromethanopterin reductase-like flavin-dependent oxidoreductase (luciferase family)
MRYGITMPNFVPLQHAAEADMQRFVEWARLAEHVGWDGFFLWDHLVFMHGEDLCVWDPWVLMATLAVATERIKIGPMVTPLPRRRPWQVARQAASLDHLSNGRLILGVGIGAPTDVDFVPFGEPGDNRTLARKLDEGLDIVGALWSGEAVTVHGEHYQLNDVRMLPRPKQQPRVPIWVAALWPNRAPVRRAARWDGIFPLKISDGRFATFTPDDLRDVLGYVREHRASDQPFDAVVAGWTGQLEPQAARQMLASYAEAGATWWLEGLDWFGSVQPEDIRKRIELGPPR